jgi:hypothetical protein
VNIQQSLNELKLIQMRALTNNAAALETHRVHYAEQSGEKYVGIKSKYDSGWNFRESDYRDDPAYQTLWWIKGLEAELNKTEWDMTNPQDMAIAVRAYKAVTASDVKPK